jgi:hypothetical protein
VNPRPDGREPRWGPENENVEEMLEQVADGSAYCIVPASMTEFYARPDLVWIPLEDVEPLRIALAWREHDASPLIAAFAGIVREVAMTAEPPARRDPRRARRRARHDLDAALGPDARVGAHVTRPSIRRSATV